LEANPSVSTNIHILGALREAGYEAHHPTVQKVIAFLQQIQGQQPFWYDKWHTSPYYPTAHAIIISAGYCPDLAAKAVNWLLKTQHEDGSWGTYLSTAEETAYCLQALAVWRQCGGRVPPNAIQRGQTWLLKNIKGPYPSLWIGKSLYCPELVVYSSILSALALIAQT
jgi:halimadienyl-diphosphate synthase